VTVASRRRKLSNELLRTSLPLEEFLLRKGFLQRALRLADGSRELERVLTLAPELLCATELNVDRMRGVCDFLRELGTPVATHVPVAAVAADTAIDADAVDADAVTEDAGAMPADADAPLLADAEAPGLEAQGPVTPPVATAENPADVAQKFLTTVLSARPDVLRLDVDEHVRPALRYLQQRLGLDANGLRRMIFYNPNILFKARDGALLALEAVFAYMEEVLHLTRDQVKHCVLANADFADATVEGALRPAADFVAERLGLEGADLTKLCAAQPRWLLSTSASLARQCDFLEQRLGLDAQDLRKVCLKYPFLTVNIERVLKPRIEFLETALFFDRDALRTALRKHPQLFTLDVDDRLAPNVAFLRGRLDLTAEEVATIVLKCPHTLGYNIEGKLDSVIDFIEGALQGMQAAAFPDDRDGDFPESEVREEGARAKKERSDEDWAALEERRKCKRARQQYEAKYFFLRNPTALSRNLEQRLRPRLERLEKTKLLTLSNFEQQLLPLDNGRFDNWVYDQKQTKPSKKKKVKEI